MNWPRVALTAFGLALFFYWAGGNRTMKILFGTWWFLLSRPAVAIVGSLSTVACAVLLWSSIVDNGRDPLEAPLMILGISLMCGFGAAALVVGPAWALLRSRESKREFVLPEGESLLRSFPMNHFLSFESRGGTGHLTDRAIHFHPHRFVVQQDSWSLPLDEIASVEVAGGRLVVLHDRNAKEHWLIAQNPKALAEDLQA